MLTWKENLKAKANSAYQKLEPFLQKIQEIKWEQVKEFFKLLWLNLVVQKRNFSEYLRVAFHYYSNISFLKVDTALIFRYLFNNPYSISKRFLQKREQQDVYLYGETPLTTLEQIAKECQLTEADKVIEMGCGRGRTCFWLHVFIKCPVVGIEYIPDFVERADDIAKYFHLKDLEFRCQDMLEADLSGATAIYLYGTCLEEEFIRKLGQKLQALPKGTKIITVSYPLTDYVDPSHFEIMKVFPARFTWGTADVYLHYRK